MAPTMSAAISSHDQLLPSAHSSPYSLPTPIASAQATPANHTGASKCSISSSQDVTTSDTHNSNATHADANAEVVAQIVRCFIGSLITTSYLYHRRVVLSHIIVQQLIFSVEISDLLLMLLGDIIAFQSIEFHFSQCLKHHLARQGV